MDKRRFPSEEQLEELWSGRPEFDLAAVKRRTMEQVTPPAGRRRPPLLRGLVAAALVCAMSVSAMAVADRATNGRVAAALGFRSAPAEETKAPAPPAPPAKKEPEEPAKPVKPVAAATPPEPEKKEPPAMDPQMAEALQITPKQAEQLRPAVVQVDGVSTCQDVTMTVVQMVGDFRNVNVKVRFDFPEAVPVSQQLEFRSMDFELGSCSWSHKVIERTEHSVTYLLKISAGGDLIGQTMTLTAEDFGYEVKQGVEGFSIGLKANVLTLAMVDAEGNLTIKDENVALPEDLRWEDGYASVEQPDGGQWLYYDGSRGNQILHLSGGKLTTEDRQYANFEVVVPGTWSHSWKLDYQDLSRFWSGTGSVLDGVAKLKDFRISPLSWELTAEGDVGRMMRDRRKQIDVTLVYSDGRTAEVTLKDSGASYEPVADMPEGWYDVSIHGKFETPPDMTGLTAVILEDQTLTLS